MFDVLASDEAEHETPPEPPVLSERVSACDSHTVLVRGLPKGAVQGVVNPDGSSAEGS